MKSHFQDQYVAIQFGIQETPIHGIIESIVVELEEFYYYKIKLDNGQYLYVNCNDISYITIMKRDEDKPPTKPKRVRSDKLQVLEGVSNGEDQRKTNKIPT